MFKFALKIHFIAKTKYRYLKLKHIAGIIFSFIKLSLFQAAYADWIYQLILLFKNKAFMLDEIF